MPIKMQTSPLYDDTEKAAQAMVALLRYKEIKERMPYVPEYLPTISKKEAEEMLEDIKARGLLRAFRGMQAADTTAIAGLLQRLSALPLLHQEISKVDLNPIIISVDKPIVVDALIVLKTF